MSTSDLRPCKNCRNPLPQEALYCPFCGQKDTTGKIPVRRFIGEFFESVFNLDSRFFKTLKYIFIPGRLTKEYFKGRHKTYSHPLRLFFILAVLHLALIGIVTNANVGLEDTTLKEMKIQLEKAEVYDLIEEFENNQAATGASDEVIGTVDSLKRFIKSRVDLSIEATSNFTFPTFDIDSMKINMLTVTFKDAAELPYDELKEKYGVDNAFSDMFLKQILKANNNAKSVILFGIGNMVWMLFFLLPIVALLMKLLYIRRSFFFIEHLVFLYHWHAVAFVFMSIFFLLMTKIHTGWLALFLFFIVAFGFTALRKYYGQGFFKSLVKFLMILVFYLIAMIMLVGITSLVSMLSY